MTLSQQRQSDGNTSWHSLPEQNNRQYAGIAVRLTLFPAIFSPLQDETRTVAAKTQVRVAEVTLSMVTKVTIATSAFIF
jgi:hypothetical protein